LPLINRKPQNWLVAVHTDSRNLVLHVKSLFRFSLLISRGAS
jgi:hypothetical protein